MGRKIRSQNLGERADAQANGLAAQFRLSRAEVERVALDCLSRHADEFSERLRASRGAEAWVREVAHTFGPRAQLQLKAGREIKVWARRAEHALPGTLVVARKVDGRVRLDVIVAVGGEELAIEALRVADGDEAVVPIGAVHVAGPVPPAKGEIKRRGPTGVERIVWAPDGDGVRTYAPELRPSRSARFV